MMASAKSMRTIYLILVCFAAPVAALVAWIRGLRDPSRRERSADRFGRPRISLQPPVFWVHAASMGEVQAGAVLVRRLLQEYPSHQIVMTTMTTTGADRVRSQFPERVTHCFLPYDLPFAVRGFLDRVQPQKAIILETELWPNLLCECHRRGISVVIASARISPRTADRYRRFAGLFSEALAKVVVAAQSEADAQSFKTLGARNVQVTGNLKFDIEVPEAVRVAGASLRKAIGSRFVWVAGSTHDGEEDAVLAAHRELKKSSNDALLILAPRHPQRFAEVRALLSRQDLKSVSRASGAPVDASISVLLVDTMGELLSCYAAADLAFVGGSLVPVGGHNLLEPAALGVPVMCGPFMSSSQDVFDRLAEAGGVLQVSRDQLAKAVLRLFANANERRSLGEQAQGVLQANRGATTAVLTLVSSAVSDRLP
jgi:3-deoxy-D-manno-octulosonic-acid transferase